MLVRGLRTVMCWKSWKCWRWLVVVILRVVHWKAHSSVRWTRSKKNFASPPLPVRPKATSQRGVAAVDPDFHGRGVFAACVLRLPALAAGDYVADLRFGVQSGQTCQARCLLCLAGTSWSFAASSVHLREFCGLQVAAGTIRNVCHAEAAQVERWQSNASEASAEYRKTSGEIEFFTDGTFVNTMDGWKEMRIGVFSKRKLGESASPDQWNQRTLPPIEARHVFAAIESADAFAARWPLVASRLGIRGSRRIDVVADGARWIWDRVSTLLAGGRRSARYLSCLGARGGHGQGPAWRRDARNETLE